MEMLLLKLTRLWTALLVVWVLVRCQDLKDLEEVTSSSNTTAPLKCPSECTCPTETIVDCAGKDLVAFPQDLSFKTQQLSLQNNMIKELTVEHVSHLVELETLNLQNNLLSSEGLEDEGFEMLEQLAYLYLANNELSSAPKALPHSLVSADFAANHLTRVYPYTFGFKPKLRSVYLHNNKLTDAGLPEHMFNHSDGLQVLTMSSNSLREVPRNLPPSLYRLHLKSNKLEKIPPGAFGNLSNLRELHLQDNLLSNQGIDNETFSKLSGLEFLDLSNNNLEEVPKGLPRGLLLLHLEKNSIRSIPPDALSPLRNLEYLLLHHNKLRSRSIHATAFQGLKKLHTLHMYNNLLERVPRGLPRRAKTLMILHNSISEIGRNDLALLYTLTELNLSYNKLSSPKVHHEAFRKLRNLETLDLSGNGLHSFPLGLPRSLHILEIKNNQISSIPDGALTGMDKLTKLILSNNQLKLNSAYQGAWMELSALTTLDLSGNLLSHIPTDLPESLQYLHLQSNRISSVPESAFQNTPNLQGLFLRYNRLTVDSIDRRAFSHLSPPPSLDLDLELGFLPRQTDPAHVDEEEET